MAPINPYAPHFVSAGVFSLSERQENPDPISHIFEERLLILQNSRHKNCYAEEAPPEVAITIDQIKGFLEQGLLEEALNRALSIKDSYRYLWREDALEAVLNGAFRRREFSFAWKTAQHSSDDEFRNRVIASVISVDYPTPSEQEFIANLKKHIIDNCPIDRNNIEGPEITLIDCLLQKENCGFQEAYDVALQYPIGLMRTEAFCRIITNVQTEEHLPFAKNALKHIDPDLHSEAIGNALDEIYVINKPLPTHLSCAVQLALLLPPEERSENLQEIAHIALRRGYRNIAMESAQKIPDSEIQCETLFLIAKRDAKKGKADQAIITNFKEAQVKRLISHAMRYKQSPTAREIANQHLPLLDRTKILAKYRLNS